MACEHSYPRRRDSTGFLTHFRGKMMHEGMGERKGAIMAHPPACLASPLPPSHSLATPPHAPPGAPFPNPPSPSTNRSARPIRPRSIVVRGGFRRAGRGAGGPQSARRHASARRRSLRSAPTQEWPSIAPFGVYATPLPPPHRRGESATPLPPPSGGGLRLPPKCPPPHRRGAICNRCGSLFPSALTTRGPP